MLISRSTHSSLLSLRQIAAITITLSILLACSSHAADYVLGTGDVIKISVYENDDLDTVARVNESGFITMPLIGQVNVANLKTTEAISKITALLADGYLINPQVDIFVQQFRVKRVTVLGHVNKPGVIHLQDSSTFLDVLALAGGMQDGYGDTATIKRKTEEEGDVIVINIRALIKDGDLKQNIPIHEGDSIHISQGGTCYVTGHIGKSGAYPCGKGTTVLRLITLAGGFTGLASQSSVRIIRLVDGEKTVLKSVDLGTTLHANDIVVVPESFF